MHVNYVLENKAFMEFAADNKVTANERLLWYALLHVFNARAKGPDWPEDFIAISNRRLLSLVPFSVDSLEKARNRLKQRGRIDYRPGQRNTQNPMYAMCYFTAEETPYYPQNTGNIRGNIQGNAGGNKGGNIGGNRRGNVAAKGADIIRKPNGNPKPNVNQNETGVSGHPHTHTPPRDNPPGFLPWEDVGG